MPDNNNSNQGQTNNGQADNGLNISEEQMRSLLNMNGGQGATEAGKDNTGAQGKENTNQGGDGKEGTQNQSPTINLQELGFKDADEIKSFRDKYTQIEKELTEAKAQPKFASDRQKLLYDFATSKFEGMELEGAKKYIDLVSLDLGKVADHDLRFKAFELRPENKGLTQDELLTLFADQEIKNFGDPTQQGGQTEAQKIYAKQATALAKAEIEKVQKEFTSARTAQAPSAEEIASQKAKYLQQVQQKLSKFDGIQTKLTAQAEDGKTIESNLAFKVDSEKQLPLIQSIVADPQGWFDQELEKYGVIDPKTQSVNEEKFAALVTRWALSDELINEAYRLGRSEQLADQLKSKRNASSSGTTNFSQGSTNTPGGTGDEKKDMIAGALKHIGVAQ